MTSVTLVGGGRGLPSGVLWQRFVDDATARAGDRTPRIVVVSIWRRGARRQAAKLTRAMRCAGPVDPQVVALRPGGTIEAGAFARLDGLLVGGGLTPAYLDAVGPHAVRIRALAADGVPYAGFSAGAAIAAPRALVGGYRHGGVTVVPSGTAEDLDELTVRDGLGLTDHAVDVHAAQWGTLSRLVAAVEAGLLPGGTAIDENTALVVHEGRHRVVGVGAVWHVASGPDGTTVRREVAL